KTQVLGPESACAYHKDRQDRQRHFRRRGGRFAPPTRGTARFQCEAREVVMSTTIGELAAVIGDLPRHWWVVGLRGLAAIIFGIMAFIWPGITQSVLVLLFGAYAIVDGVLALYAAARSGGQNVWAPLLEGVLGIIAGIVAFVWPGLTALTLVYII